MNGAERWAVAGFLVATVAAVGLTVVYGTGGQPQAEGVLLAIAFGGIGFGFVTWANRLLPQGPFVEARPPLGHPGE
ncbi:MAG: hypothetical protein H0W70_14950, partial [Actinobacteria bacterium]|nr:hypothetical protein [Actinomycetota bacterium]